ncbi:serine/threonine protein kinase [Streptomyces sp. XM4193]|uniref:serine/threonine-protein kinase n=1 Tax=Streptomyces sp. XM4193 TaxID=2929782 RepID=UPI001FFA4A27|nr:serine/threonine protein kinase [Streptomyces sp. XM4193]
MQPLGEDDPRSIGEYRLLRRLGAGGMGLVYLGRSPGGRTVAVKVVHAHYAADEHFRARFRLEIEAGRRVGGDWTAPVLDADPDAPTPWVATGYVAGPSLRQAVETQGALPEQTVRALGAGLGEALTAVHRLDLVHRDVKPSNVLLTLDGPRLIDFGVARATDATASLTATGVSVGSPGFMSPEQVLGRDTDRAADVFSLGAVLAFAATGEPPFPGSSSATLLYKVVHEEPELHALTGELRELVAAALDKDPARRPTSAMLADRLSGGEGAATLVVPGWLPPLVVEGVSRRAVELLGLEADGSAPRTDARPPADTPTAPLGGFGPPGSGLPSASPYRTPPPQPAPYPHLAAPHPSPAAAARPMAASPRPGWSQGHGTMAPHSGDTPPPGAPVRQPPRAKWGKGRRIALAVGLVIATGVVPGGISLMLPDGGGSGGGSSSGTDSGGKGGATKDDDPSALPVKWVGTWRGVITSRAGDRIDLTTTIRAGNREERLVRTTHDVQGVQCKGVARVDRITEAKLELTEFSDGDSPEVLGMKVCAEGSSRADLLLGEDGTMTYRSHEERSGRPTGELDKDGD